jgi:hypothetical protein
MPAAPKRPPKRPAAKPSRRRAVSPSADVPEDAPWVAALRDEIAALARAVAAQTDAIARLQPGPGTGTPAPPTADVVTRLGESAELLASTAADLPRAEDFQPLADHLYAFAESAPRLVERLEAVREAVAPLEAAAVSLAEVAETLVATHHGWSESLLRLPRAEDYEPLTVPLREFARVSPLLAETLAAVVKAVTPLPVMVQQVLGAAASGGSAPAARAHADLRAPLEEAADRMSAARTAIREGLSSLPRDRAYAEAAAHLRELATVSPSLMEWLRQLPAMSLPLGDAIASLDAAARDLEQAERAARDALDLRTT